MHADNTVIYYSHKSIKQIEVKLQADQLTLRLGLKVIN